MKKYPFLLPAAIFLLAIILRVIYLDKSLSGDEINSVLGSRQHIAQISAFIVNNDSYPPLQYFLLHFWLWLGDSEIWIRILYVIFGIGVCLSAYFTGKEYVDTRFGLYSMFFVAISPQLVHISQYARGIVISTFFVTSSIYFLIKIFKGKGGIANWLGYVFCSVCALYSFYFTVLILIAENIYMFLGWKKMKDIIKKWMLAQLSIGVFLLPGLPFFVKHLLYIKGYVESNYNLIGHTVQNKGFIISGLPLGSFARGILGTFGMDPFFMSNVALSQKWPASLLFLMTMICILVLSGILFRAGLFLKENTRIVRFFQSLVISPIILSMVIRYINKGYPIMVRYFAPLCVFFVFLIVSAILSFKNKLFRNSAFSILAALFILRLPYIYSSMEEWREAGTYITGRVSSGDCVVFLEKGRNDFKYYANLDLPEFVVAGYFTRNADFDFSAIENEKSVKLGNMLKPYPRAWVILTPAKVFGGSDILKGWFLENGFHQAEEKKFNGIEVILYRK